jgi:DNA topoisomerase III
LATLVIAEKPDVAVKIAQAIIGKYTKKDGYFEGNGYLITFAVGHLLGLAEPEVYNERYKKWDLNDLPIIPNQFLLAPNPKASKQLKVISNLVKECTDVINACDSAREGELIFRYIWQYLKINKPIKRLWISSLTKSAIQEGFRNLKPASEFENLYKAARSRSQADWLIGMNGSRAFTTKFGNTGQPLSVGRVQTPVLAMIYDRQSAIENFKPQKFYEVEATFSQGDVTYKGIWIHKDRIFEKEKAEFIAKKVAGKQGIIINFESTNLNETPPLLFDLGDLQQEANAKFGFTTDHTLQIAQLLYEKHAAITYPRTNSNYVAEDNIPVMHKVLDQLKGTAYDALVQKASKNLVHPQNKNICRPDEIEDHHAIFPTENIPQLFDLTKDEQRLYDLIVRRFLSHFYPDALYKKHSIITEVENENFRTSVKELLDKGWKVVYDTFQIGSNDETEREEDNLELTEEIKEDFRVDPNKPVNCINSETIERTTTPPKWFTEGSLIKAMKTAGKEITDEALRKELKGLELGTPATRSKIIETLKKRGYIELNKRKLVVTDKGKSLIETIRNTDLTILTSPEMTAVWEKYLRSISIGQGSETQFMSSVRQFAEKIVAKVKEHQGISKDAFINNIGSCPACKEGKIVESPRAYGCSRYKEGCKFTIWKEQFNKTLTIKNIQDLLTKGKTPELKFKNKNGKEYIAKLVLQDLETGKIGLEFKDNPHSPTLRNDSQNKKHDQLANTNSHQSDSLGKCIVCTTGEIIDKGAAYKCNSCEFVVWKKISGKTLPISQIRKLIKTGQTDEIVGFISRKTGKQFKAPLHIVNGKVEFAFK